MNHNAETIVAVAPQPPGAPRKRQRTVAERFQARGAALADDEIAESAYFGRPNPLENLVIDEHLQVEKYVLSADARLYRFSVPTQVADELRRILTLPNMRPARQPTFSIRGKTVNHPRLIRSYGRDYTFSGQIHKATSPALTPPLLTAVSDFIGKICRDLCDISFTPNEQLVNWYRNGLDYIAPHSDNEGPLKKSAEHGAIVATLSLGAERTLRIRAKNRGSAYAAYDKDVLLTHGSVYVMEGPEFQANYTHQIPKVTGKRGLELGERISVTLREFN